MVKSIGVDKDISILGLCKPTKMVQFPYPREPSQFTDKALFGMRWQILNWKEKSDFSQEKNQLRVNFDKNIFAHLAQDDNLTVSSNCPTFVLNF